MCVLFYGECRLCEIQNCDNLPGVTRRWCWSKTPSDCSARPQALSPERHQDLGDRVAKSKGSEEFYPKKTHLICNISNFATKCVNGPQMKIIKETHGGVCIESLWNTFLFVLSRATEIQTNREVDMIKCDVNTVIGVLAQLPSFSSSMALKVKYVRLRKIVTKLLPIVGTLFQLCSMSTLINSYFIQLPSSFVVNWKNLANTEEKSYKMCC